MIPIQFEQLLALLIHNYCHKYNQAPDLRAEQVLSGSCPSFIKLITTMRKVKAFLTSYPEYTLTYYNPQKRYIIVPYKRAHKPDQKLYYILDTQQETWSPQLLRLIIGQHFDPHAILLVEDNVIDKNQECSLCLESGVDQPTLCGHAFHASCLQHWLETSTTCPLCRVVLVD